MPKMLDRFKLHDPLATQGDIVLYRAEEELPGGATRNVLLKTFPALAAKDKSIEVRFHAQVGMMAQLSGNAYAVSLYSAGVADPMPWIAMEMLPNSAATLNGERPGDPASLEKMLRHVATVLGAMHAMNPPMLHNSVVPENIHIDSLGNFKLGGFDSCGPASSETPYTAATIQYAAPEMISPDLGKPGPASDLYALGHVAYEIALGTRLYRAQFPAVFDPKVPKQEATTSKWMAWHYSMGAKIPPVAELVKEFPQGLSDVIARLTAKPLSERLATAAAVLAELDRTRSLVPAADGSPAARAMANSPSAPGMTPAPLTPSTPRAPVAPRGFTRTTPAAADPSAPKFYLRLRGRMTGPFDLATLQRHVKQGAVSRLHEVSSDRQNWQPATSLEGLFAAPPTPPNEA